MLLLALDTSAAVNAAVHDGTGVLAGELVHDPRPRGWSPSPVSGPVGTELTCR